MKVKVPKAISDQQRQGGLARAEKYTSEELSEQSRRAWKTRVANERKKQTRPAAELSNENRN